MKNAKSFLVFLAVGTLVLAACHVSALNTADGAASARRRALVHALTLTDLAIWTEARYTRHPSQADRFSAFQESPAAPDHFPAGSILSPATLP